MNSMRYEWRLIIRSRLCAAALLLLLLLSSLAVWSGLREVARERATIAHVAQLHDAEMATMAERYKASDSAGNPAYYTFYRTWDAPSNAAFMALGLRDVNPYIMRIRALGLQAQLHEGETVNPELALPGRFDFAFVLIYLLPLFLIALLYDLVSGERQAGRLRMLQAMPGSAGRLWYRRAGLRAGLVLACLAGPLLFGMLYAGMQPVAIAITLAVVVSYVAFWVGVSVLVATRGWRTVANATALMACWVMLTLILPTCANVVLMRTVPVAQGVELMLAQRQIVHGAWEVPRDETMRRFLRTHPEWTRQAGLDSGFRWKWYFAFHQVGDESVAGQLHAYQEGLMARQQWTARLGWLLPAAAAQAMLHRVAETDLQAQLSYQHQITVFHRQIRAFYYPYLFNDRPFGAADFARRPGFAPRVLPAPRFTLETLLLGLLGALLLACGGVALGRMRAGR